MNSMTSPDRFIHINKSISVYLTGNVVEVNNGDVIVSQLTFVTELEAILEYETSKYEISLIAGKGA